ncbi:pilus assembly protein [Solibacillus sp. CAU 1738]|uniref:pilus assembly protein n=1 Tax=Solibacillus sp. CAU 1738 TaxID=3140363 RepID=UPI003260CD5B
MRAKKVLRSEKGSISIEFLGILPFYFLFFLLLWQVVASGFAVFNLKAAALEGAQIYAMSENDLETEAVINQSLEGGELLTNYSFQINRDPHNSDLFVITVTAKHPLVFLPNSWRENTLITLNSKATGKVLVP